MDMWGEWGVRGMVKGGIVWKEVLAEGRVAEEKEEKLVGEEGMLIGEKEMAVKGDTPVGELERVLGESWLVVGEDGGRFVVEEDGGRLEVGEDGGRLVVEEGDGVLGESSRSHSSIRLSSDCERRRSSEEMSLELSKWGHDSSK